MRPRESEQNVTENSQPAGLGLDAVLPSGTGALWEVTAASSTVQERTLCLQEVAGCRGGLPVHLCPGFGMVASGCWDPECGRDRREKDVGI